MYFVTLRLDWVKFNFKFNRHQLLPQSTFQTRSKSAIQKVSSSRHNMIVVYVKDNHQHWERWLPEFCIALNSALHDSMGFTSAEVVLGYKLYGEDVITSHLAKWSGLLERQNILVQLVKDLCSPTVSCKGRTHGKVSASMERSSQHPQDKWYL